MGFIGLRWVHSSAYIYSKCGGAKTYSFPKTEIDTMTINVNYRQR